MQTKKINLLIAYDQLLLADGLKVFLAQKKEINLIGCISNNKSFFNRSFDEPDVILFELARWPSHYLDYLKRVAKYFPQTRFILVSELIKQEYLLEVMKIAHGYLLRTCSADKVYLAVQEVVSSGKYLCPREMEELFATNTNQVKPELTIRESQILSEWLTSDDNSGIANKLNICESTVRSHLKNIREKIKATTKIKMLIYACKNNILNHGMDPICPNCKYSCKEPALRCN